MAASLGECFLEGGEDYEKSTCLDYSSDDRTMKVGRRNSTEICRNLRVN